MKQQLYNHTVFYQHFTLTTHALSTIFAHAATAISPNLHLSRNSPANLYGGRYRFMCVYTVYVLVPIVF